MQSSIIAKCCRNTAADCFCLSGAMPDIAENENKYYHSSHSQRMHSAGRLGRLASETTGAFSIFNRPFINVAITRWLELIYVKSLSSVYSYTDVLSISAPLHALDSDLRAGLKIAPRPGGGWV